MLIHICSALEELMKYHSLNDSMSTGEKESPFALTEEEEGIYHALYEKNVGEFDNQRRGLMISCSGIQFRFSREVRSITKKELSE